MSSLLKERYVTAVLNLHVGIEGAADAVLGGHWVSWASSALWLLSSSIKPYR